MAIISVPNTFSANTTISSSEVNANFSTIYNEFNGSITAANLATDAVTTGKIADEAVTTAKIGPGAVTSAKLSAAVKDTGDSSGDFSTGNVTLSSISVPAGTWLLIFKVNIQFSVAQETYCTGEIYNSTDATVIDTCTTGTDWTSGTANTRNNMACATVVTLAGTKTIISRVRVNDGSGTSQADNANLLAIPVGA